MRAFIKFEPALYEKLLGHLLPPHDHREQAAFVFLKVQQSGGQLIFEPVETMCLSPQQFEQQEGDYLELSDETRAMLIKRAHDLGASILEMHSHPGPWPAGFSRADQIGLQETVPHMWWRLKSRPYLAIVVAKSGFDALLWLDGPKVPRHLDGLMVGTELLQPTNLSFGGW